MSQTNILKGPYWLNPDGDESSFPPVEAAMHEPNGLLAFGGNLSPARLLHAYRQGIFPWYSEDQPIMWWSPDPRSVLFLSNLKISRSLQKSIRNRGYHITFDRCFDDIIKCCASPRDDDHGTWLTPEMIVAYNQLHEMGYAHSVECWQDDKLVGGLYGVALGKVFFGESMFSSQRDASKVAFVALVKQLQSWEFAFVDCQVHSPHIASLGAEEVSREYFLELLNTWL
jgi:leucyl/phenylalanyl-tRNA--protein transferase